MMGISGRRVAALIAVSVALVASAVFATATIERDSALHSSRQQEAGQRLLTAMLDQETGARGYFETRQASFLAPFYQGRGQFAAALADARSESAGDAPLLQSLSEQARLSSSWNDSVAAAISRFRATGVGPSLAIDTAQKSLIDNFSELNSLFQTQVGTRRDSALSRAAWLAVGVAVVVSILLVGAAILLTRRVARREQTRLGRLQELRDMLQVAASEQESRLLLIHHVERIVRGSRAAVLTRNNSDDRLEPTLGESAGDTSLRELTSEHLQPRSCMAVRLSRPYRQHPGSEPLQRCEACGKLAANVVCEPLLVGGQVIGSVLVARERSIAPPLGANVHESVVQAAPILANHRNLALAERRAASDALTGLPNRRAADETLTRMAAHAGRTITPLSVVIADLDHFKQVNDLHGHDLGDRALATVAQILAGGIRASDFAARYGGEEFLFLLPDTDRAGAVEVAEKLRRAVAQAEVRDLGPMTASFGIATLPDDAAEPDELVRNADRALYAAKALGRNRVEVAMPIPDIETGDAEHPQQDG